MFVFGCNSMHSGKALPRLPLWLNTVHGGLERLLVYGPGFNSQGWPSNLGQDRVRVRFEINFLDSKEGSTVSSNL